MNISGRNQLLTSIGTVRLQSQQKRSIPWIQTQAAVSIPRWVEHGRIPGKDADLTVSLCISVITRLKDVAKYNSFVLISDPVDKVRSSSNILWLYN